MKIDNITMQEIRERHAGHVIDSFDAGVVFNEASQSEVQATDVLVWASEEDADNDDGSKAIARYLILC